MDSTQHIPPSDTPGSSPPLGEIIGKIMADKELMSTIASVMGSVGGNSPPAEEEKTDESPQAPQASQKLPEMIEALAPMLGSSKGDIKNSLLGALPQKDDRRICLLRAIKPYVSRGRGEAIDYMIQLSRLSELMKHLG